jgi:hypothetical protein
MIQYLEADILLGLFDAKDGGYLFLRNVGWRSTYCTALCPIRSCHRFENLRSYKLASVTLSNYIADYASELLFPYVTVAIPLFICLLYSENLF